MSDAQAPQQTTRQDVDDMLDRVDGLRDLTHRRFKRLGIIFERWDDPRKKDALAGLDTLRLKLERCDYFRKLLAEYDGRVPEEDLRHQYYFARQNLMLYQRFYEEMVVEGMAPYPEAYGMKPDMILDQNQFNAALDAVFVDPNQGESEEERE